MTPIEILALIVAIFSILDAIIGLAKPKIMFSMISKGLKSNYGWIIPTVIFAGFLVFGYFTTQQLTLIQIIPGLFLGVLIAKTEITMHPKEVLPLAKQIYTKTEWFAIALDIVLAGSVFWILFA